MKVTKYGTAIIFDGREVDKQWYPTKEKAYNRLKYDSSRKYIGTRDFDLYCERCDKELNLGDNYIKCDEETRYCESCYEENSITYYTVDGELVGDENDTEAYDDCGLEAECEEKMKIQSEIQKKNVTELLNLIQENPDLPIVPMVEYEVVASDEFSTWLGSFGKAEIDHVWDNEERIYFMNHDYEELIQDILDDLPLNIDEETAEATATDAVKKYEWVKSIVVPIGLP